MSGSNASIKGRQHITPPSSFVDAPLTPPPTDEKAFTQAPRIISLLKDIQAGRHIEVLPWTVFQLARGEYEDFQRRLHQDELLFGYAKDKIRCVAFCCYEEAMANDANRTGMITT